MEKILFVLPGSFLQNIPKNSSSSYISQRHGDKYVEGLHEYILNAFDSSVRDPNSLLLAKGEELARWQERWKSWPDLPSAPCWKIYQGNACEALQYTSPDSMNRIWFLSPFYGLTQASRVIAPYRLYWKAFIPGIGQPQEYWITRVHKAFSDRLDIEVIWTAVPEELELFVQRSLPGYKVMNLRGLTSFDGKVVNTNGSLDAWIDIIRELFRLQPISCGEFLSMGLPDEVQCNGHGENYMELKLVDLD